MSGDILFAGDITKWKKFCNSLRLRCLLRISDRQDPTAEMTAIVNDPTNNPLFTSNAEQAALQYLEQLGNEFPNFYDFGYGCSASKNLVDQLTALNDPRLLVFAQPTQATMNSATKVYAGCSEWYRYGSNIQWRSGESVITRLDLGTAESKSYTCFEDSCARFDIDLC
ncbi:MAG: SusD/RagB family nutrient-binding outer membrane lipoprotein [Bacteroidota bacterium]